MASIVHKIMRHGWRADTSLLLTCYTHSNRQRTEEVLTSSVHLIEPYLPVLGTSCENHKMQAGVVDLSKLSFGAPAAKLDMGVGLDDYFFESDAYQRLAARQKMIVVGNRGTGEGAIFKVFAERARRTGTLVLELRPEDYSYELLSSLLKSERQGSWAKHGAFAAAWKYLILVLVMKEITKQSPKLKSGPAERIYTYLRDNHAGTRDTPISVLVSYLKRIEGSKIGKYEASLKTRELIKLYKLEKLDAVLPCLTELVEKRRVASPRG